MNQDLFREEYLNLLPFDGEAWYYPRFLEQSKADHYLAILLDEIAWRQEPIKIFGKEVMQPRLTSWYGDPGKIYSYSGITMIPQSWTTALGELKHNTGSFAQSSFNSALLNLYRDGNDSMGWHRDNEKELGPRPVIASLSLGGPRIFQFRSHLHKDQLKSIELIHGSLLVMKGDTQEKWEHRLPKSKIAKTPRINITFRKIL